MDPDLNHYDVEHVCTRASADEPGSEWEAIYREAWSLYYSPAHMETLLRRAVATGVAARQSDQAAAHLRDHGAAGERASAAERRCCG